MPEWVIPVEHETGIPLVIEAHEDLPPPGVMERGADWHHHVYPKKRDEILTPLDEEAELFFGGELPDSAASPSGSALRQVRLQWINRKNHTNYHRHADTYMAEKWEFPGTVAERFGMTVLMAARYMPPQAIRATRKGLKYVEIDEAERHRYWEKGILKIAQGGIVYEFLRDFTLAQDIGSLASEVDIEQFLYEKDGIKRVQIGNSLLELAAMAATEDIRPTYLEAYKNRLILPELPAEPQGLIIDEPIALGTPNRRKRARQDIRQRLADQYGVLLEAA